MNPKHYKKYKKLGLNIAYYRKDKGLTQEQLAESLNVDRTTISKLELAISSASLDVIFSLADALDLPVYKLFEFR